MTGPEGAIQVTRLSGEVEVLRLLGVVHEAWRRVSTARFEECVAVVHAGDFASVLCRKVPFTPEQLARLEAYVERAGMGLDHGPGRVRGGVVEAFVRADDKAAFQASVPSRIDPVFDDRPYFFHFNRFLDWAGARELLNAPASQVQGNPLFVLVQLAVAALLSALLLLLPLRGRAGGGRGADRRGARLLPRRGVGFVAIEVTLMQEPTLLVGHPVHSITVTLASILVATGLGASSRGAPLRARTPPSRRCPSRWRSWPSRGTAWGRPVRWERRRDSVRLVLGALVAPFGLVLGVPFAHGIALLRAAGAEPRAPAGPSTPGHRGRLHRHRAGIDGAGPVVLLAGVAATWGVARARLAPAAGRLSASGASGP